MKIINTLLASLLLATTVNIPSQADEGTVHLTSLDWPPYTGPQLQDGGCLTLLVKQAFEVSGLTASVDFYPWSRTIAQVRDSHSQHLGFFPAYYSAERERDYYMTDPLGEGPIGLIERKDLPIVWNTLSDLAGKRIGVVQDYINTAEFDALASSGKLVVEAVVSDTLNIRKMIGNRIDTAVIDKHVFHHLLDTDPDLAAGKTLLQFNPKPLESKKLYLYFRRTPEGLALRDRFNTGLKQVLTTSDRKGIVLDDPHQPKVLPPVTTP